VVAGAILAELQTGCLDRLLEPGTRCQMGIAERGPVYAAIAGAANLGQGIEVGSQAVRVDAEGF
jgi:hypothetical protein